MMIGYTDDTPGSQRLPGGIEFVFPAAAQSVADREARGDFLLFVGDDTPELLGHMQPAAEAVGMPFVAVQLDRALRESDLSADFHRSDHSPFWAQGYPAVMITDTAEFRNPYYHCSLGEDDIDTIDMDFAVLTTAATVGAVAAAIVPAAGDAATGREVAAEPALDPLPLLCDPVAGACDDGQRCTIVAQPGLHLACVPSADTPLGVDDPCERDENGADTCADGLVCTLTGLPRGSPRRCRPLCRGSADCEGDTVCPNIGIDVSNCIATCDPFGDVCPVGTACTTGVSPDRRGEVLNCRPAADAGEGEDCSDADCAPGLDCNSTLSRARRLGCIAFCRPSAPDCNPGRTCVPYRRLGLPDDMGYCLPDDPL